MLLGLFCIFILIISGKVDDIFIDRKDVTTLHGCKNVVGDIVFWNKKDAAW